MKNITLEQLLEVGSHFGHQVTRQNPKARDYIFEARDNIHIIDLAKTKEGLDEAAEFVKNLARREGSTMIILGAKRQAETLVKDASKKAKEAGVDGLYFVTNRWIGGILTNYQEVSKNFKRLKDLTKFMDTPSEKARFTKKEVSLMEKERAKLESFYWGVADMKHVPDAVFVIDTHLEDLAVKEALATNITTVGITDTNADPTIIDYPIPANDDAVGSVELILTHIVEAWIEGRKNMEEAAKPEAEAKAKVEEKKEPTKEKVASKEEKVKKTPAKKTTK
ncbi:MAG: 30S ribosomal protein S2 [Candidatus Levybacteria bacterium]|nr:30S ribosomal protein S2 [Candidatus Levybacteria bacterium]